MMMETLSAPRCVILAANFASLGDTDSLGVLAGRHGDVLRKELVLRLLLTLLPETTKSSEYVGLIEALEADELSARADFEIDCSSIETLDEDQAAKQVLKLKLLPLTWRNAPADALGDPTALFLVRRAYRVDEEAGLLDELPGLLVPFLDHAPCIRTFMVSAVLPLLRRNCEYYPHDPILQTLPVFDSLPDRLAVELLLSQTGVRDQDLAFIGRDLKGLIGPWLFNERRWTGKTGDDDGRQNDASQVKGWEEEHCPGWQQVLEWLTAKAAKSWKLAVAAVEQWDGPGDVDIGEYGVMWLRDEKQQHLERTYAQAAIASAYLIPEASTEALRGAFTITAKIACLMGQDPIPPLPAAASILPPVADPGVINLVSPRNATYLRNDLLQNDNVLTSPTKAATELVRALILSAFILTKAGAPCSIRRAGELALLQDEREQKVEAKNFVYAVGSNASQTDGNSWIRARNEALWLRDWGAEEYSSESQIRGVFGQLKVEFLETEILKALLANSHYDLARSLYEDSADHTIPRTVLQDTIFAAAMTAYDNASNPNRTRGGVKKCDEIIRAFPRTIERSLVATQRIEALLKATHSLSEYRLVLKQGEPFRPVRLRVHPDPISIIGKILEQNPQSYTRMQHLLDLGANMIEAGLGGTKDKNGDSSATPEQEAVQRAQAERRITAMCIDAALIEDDFETAYSYVTNRLAAFHTPNNQIGGTTFTDDYSWRAALQAGKYRRTDQTSRPTHLGIGSGNLEIRHLEQRLECLSAALRIAPAPTLQEILKAFRRTEEALDSAMKVEAEREEAWDMAADNMQMPGGFRASTPASNVSRQVLSVAAVSVAAPRPAASLRAQRTSTKIDEAPMSLFDLSRASVKSAQRNFTALSSLQRSALGRLSGSSKPVETGQSRNSEDESDGQHKERFHLREAAMGTLVSGVSWLINAPSHEREHQRE